jgi:GTP-binding protein HflX
VWNKIDLTGLEPGVERDEYGKICRVRLSAKTGAGVDFLRLALIEVATSGITAPIHPKLPQAIEA